MSTYLASASLALHFLRGILKESSRQTYYGIHRVTEPPSVLPQAAERLDASVDIWPDETLVRLEYLSLDAASFRQLFDKHRGDGEKIRLEVLDIIRRRGKMHNSVTDSGGMFLGTVESSGPESGNGLKPGDRIASLVSLTLTPLVIEDDLAQWDGLSTRVPANGYAILFASAGFAIVPEDLPASLVVSVLDVCGAASLTARVVSEYAQSRQRPRVVVVGASGRSGSLSAVAAKRAGADQVLGVVPNEDEAVILAELKSVDEIVVADARQPMAMIDALGERADITVVCVDVPGCEHSAILATVDGGIIIFFSMSTSFQAAALGAEGVGADVTMLIGTGFVPGHSDLALNLVREEPVLRKLMERKRDG